MKKHDIDLESAVDRLMGKVQRPMHVCFWAAIAGLLGSFMLIMTGETYWAHRLVLLSVLMLGQYFAIYIVFSKALRKVLSSSGVVEQRKLARHVFNPNSRENLTIKEQLEPAMAITTQQDADQYFRQLVAYVKMQPKVDGYRSAEQYTSEMLVQYSTYYEPYVNDRVKELFGGRG